MKIYSKYQTDERAETDGVWIDIGDGAKIKVARFNNPNHVKVITELKKPYEAQLRVGVGLSDSVRDSLAREAMARAILLDWEGIEGEDGQPLPYSFENALKLLTELKDFFDQVAGFAASMETFRKSALEEAAKNSARVSAGTSKAAGTKVS